MDACPLINQLKNYWFFKNIIFINSTANNTDYFSNPSIYNDQYAHKKDDFDFWNKEISKINNRKIKILELGAGTGRISKSILLNNKNVSYYGIDLSKEFVKEANTMLKDNNLSSNGRVVCGDMASFQFPNKFDMIFIPFNSFLHLSEIKSINNCMKCIKGHLSDSGKAYIDIFIPNPLLLYRPKGVKAHVMNYQSRAGDTIIVEEEMDYNNIDNTANIIWNFTNRNTEEIKTFSLKIMIHFPDMIMNIINESGFCIDAIYGGYDCSPLDESSVLQIYKFSINIV